MIYLAKDRDGREVYDFGNGKHYITIIKQIINNDKTFILPECYLIAKGKNVNVKIKIVNNGNLKLFITDDVEKGFFEVLNFNELSDCVKRLYLKIEGDIDDEFNSYLVLEYEEI